jgi:hypothetical protein
MYCKTLRFVLIFLLLDLQFSYNQIHLVTRLKNYITSTQVGESTKCHLSKFPVWPSKGRSEGNALSLNFLAQYSAAVHVDLLHSLSL